MNLLGKIELSIEKKLNKKIIIIIIQISPSPLFLSFIHRKMKSNQSLSYFLIWFNKSSLGFFPPMHFIYYIIVIHRPYLCGQRAAWMSSGIQFGSWIKQGAQFAWHHSFTHSSAEAVYEIHIERRLKNIKETEQIEWNMLIERQNNLIWEIWVSQILGVVITGDFGNNLTTKWRKKRCFLLEISWLNNFKILPLVGWSR